VRVDNQDLKLTTSEIIVDSGTSFLLISDTDFVEFRAVWEKKYKCD
jgi:hypothetical protein